MTPSPVYQAAPTRFADPCASLRMDHRDKSRIRTAAYHASRRYPGPVGELLARELLAWEGFGFRFGGGDLVGRLVDHLMAEL